MLKLNLGCGGYRLKGFVNLDKKRGWKFQDGLPNYGDNSVDAITISHALMFLNNLEMKALLKEAYRVLKPDGIIRITEDNTTDPRSSVYGGWGNKVISLTDPKMMRARLEKAGFKAYDLNPDETHFIDKSLIQRFHGEPPKVFHIEGIK